MFETKSMMTSNVIAVKRDTPIVRAIEILIEQNVTGLPVVNDDMTLAGIISEKDTLGLLAELEDESAKVEDYMTTDVVTFDQEDDLIAICECLVNNNFRRVPILDDGKLVGIISRKDIIKYILAPL
ncbi:MAG: CBS domain-containing protein [Planctomycetota bacterium]